MAKNMPPNTPPSTPPNILAKDPIVAKLEKEKIEKISKSLDECLGIIKSVPNKKGREKWIINSIESARSKINKSKEGQFLNEIKNENDKVVFTEKESIPVDEIIEYISEYINEKKIKNEPIPVSLEESLDVLQKNSGTYEELHPEAWKDSNKKEARIKQEETYTNGDWRKGTINGEESMKKRRELILLGKEDEQGEVRQGISEGRTLGTGQRLQETKAEETAKKATEEEKKLRNQKIEEVRKAVDDARKEYLEIDYKKNGDLKRIRKFFFGKNTGDSYLGKDNDKDSAKMKKYETDQEIAYSRARYDNKLFDLQKLLIEDAKDRGASDKELADLFIEFRTEQKITVADEHDKVKAEKMDETGWGRSGKVLLGISEKYRKLSFTKKMLIAGGLLAGGLFIGGYGGLAASAAMGVFVGRRAFGGWMAGLGAKKWLEARGQKKSRENVEKEKQEFLKKLEGLTPEQKYDLLSGRIKDIAIKDEENSINQIKNQNLKQLAVGAAVGTFIGSGMMADLIRWGAHGAAEYFSPKIAFADELKPGAAGHSGLKETIPTPKTTEVVLNVRDGSSFEGTLTKFLNVDSNHAELLKYRPDFAGKSNSFIADRLALEFAEKHQEMHGHLPDYVQAGAKLRLSMGAGGINMDIAGKDYGWYEYHEVPQNGPSSSPVGPDVSPSSVPVSPEDLNMAGGVAPVQPDAIPYNPEHDYTEIRTEMQAQNDVDRLAKMRSEKISQLYDRNGGAMNMTEPLRADAEYARIDDAYDKATENLKQIKSGANVSWENMHGVGNLIEHGAGSKEVLRESMQKITTGSADKVAAWHSIKDQPFVDAVNKSAPIRKGLVGTLNEFQKVIGQEAYPKTDMTGKPIETTGKWLARVTKAALRAKVEGGGHGAAVEHAIGNHTSGPGPVTQHLDLRGTAPVEQTPASEQVKMHLKLAPEATQAVEHQPGGEIVKQHIDLRGTAAVEHVDADHALKLKSGSASFTYDNQGNITGEKIHVGTQLTGVTGKEYLANDYSDHIKESLKSGVHKPNASALMEKTFKIIGKQVSGELKLYDELLNSGHPKEAQAVLKNIYDTMDAAEKKNGLSGIFDRSKLPKL